jgi:hypothetical protein
VRAGNNIAAGPKTDYENQDNDDYEYGLPRIKEALEATTAYTNPSQKVGADAGNASTSVAQYQKQKQQLSGLKQRLKKKQPAAPSYGSDLSVYNSSNDATLMEVNLTMDGVSLGGTSSNYRGAHDIGVKNEGREQLSARDINVQYLDNELISVKRSHQHKVAPAPPLQLYMKIVPAPITETKVSLFFFSLFSKCVHIKSLGVNCAGTLLAVTL